MSKKEYNRAAKLVRDAGDASGCTPSEAAQREYDRVLLEDAFARFFNNDNPRFDVVRFREACKVKS